MTTDTLERPVLDLDNLILTTDQQNALEAINAFMMDPVEQVFVLEGFSGCGKSTLVRILIDRLPAFEKMMKLINPSHKEYLAELTATTNKAAENLAQITGMAVSTIHSKLGLRVQTDFRTNITTLVPKHNYTPPEHVVLFIDEASKINKELLSLIFTRIKNCKVVFIGDPAQLVDFTTGKAPVFEAGFNGAALTEVVRQPKKEGGFQEMHPITAWAEQLRKTVETGVWTPFTPDGHHIQRLDRETFKAKIQAEFTRPDWRYADSKILAWTNKCVISYNQFVRNLAKGDPHFHVGDYAVCNSFLTTNKGSIKTDQLVLITSIEEETEHADVLGHWITMDHYIRAFQPRSLELKNARLKEARARNQYTLVAEIDSSWVDLRGAYAQTVDKSQGSTYGSVFIDLDDIARCNNGNQVARMLYVGESRAKNHVYLTGDLA